ncbi:hypothetical protein [uncultured Bacteroides sp.]|uniref:hypothetical protein n=1 Tax=uncultured Bacteroides sp. TaxID=162156 RepID=UPI002602C5E9|nr:hypothetical protein [uncultured Bacteroides sp.]
MNCYKHLNDYAVATCASCGAGLCQNCLDSSVYSYDGKPLCYDCNLKAAEDEMSTLSRRKVWVLIKFIFVLAFMILGFAIWQSTGDAMNAWIYAGIGGIPSAFKSTKSSERVRVVSNDIIDTLFYPFIALLIRLALIIVLAPIAAIFLVIMNLVTFFKTSSALKNTKNMYAFLLNAPNQPVQMFSASQSSVLQSSAATNSKNVDDADDSWMDSFMKPSSTKPSVMTTRLTWKTQPTAAGADKVDKVEKVEEEIKEDDDSHETATIPSSMQKQMR